MDSRLLSVDEFYARLTVYMLEVGLPWDEREEGEWPQRIAEEGAALTAVMAEAKGRSVLDCSCGWGRQALPLAQAGWKVTATDATEANLDIARRRATRLGLSIGFRLCDMRELGAHFREAFDWVVSCFALYEITTDEGIQQALGGMLGALRPGGKCYLRLRDMDFLIDEDRPRYVFHGETRTPHGRVLCVEDWGYESDTHVISTYAFLTEDDDYEEYGRWHSDVLSYRKRALRKVELAQFLRAAGFDPVEFLPQAGPWEPYQVVATKA
jgi:ubiquinone/menaquinone biosynthesis C-methylase UbiE